MGCRPVSIRGSRYQPGEANRWEPLITWWHVCCHSAIVTGCIHVILCETPTCSTAGCSCRQIFISQWLTIILQMMVMHYLPFDPVLLQRKRGGIHTNNAVLRKVHFLYQNHLMQQSVPTQAPGWPGPTGHDVRYLLGVWAAGLSLHWNCRFRGKAGRGTLGEWLCWTHHFMGDRKLRSPVGPSFCSKRDGGPAVTWDGSDHSWLVSVVPPPTLSLFSETLLNQKTASAAWWLTVPWSDYLSEVSLSGLWEVLFDLWKIWVKTSVTQQQ